jgi:hypothetical protein
MGFHIDYPLVALPYFADDTFYGPVCLVLVSYGPVCLVLVSCVFSLLRFKCLLVDVNVDALQLTVIRKL